MIQTEKHLWFPYVNKQAVHRGKCCLKLEWWQGPPIMKQNSMNLCFNACLFIQLWKQREFVCLVCSGVKKKQSMKIFLFWLTMSSSKLRGAHFQRANEVQSLTRTLSSQRILTHNVLAHTFFLKCRGNGHFFLKSRPSTFFFFFFF